MEEKIELKNPVQLFNWSLGVMNQFDTIDEDLLRELND